MRLPDLALLTCLASGASAFKTPPKRSQSSALELLSPTNATQLKAVFFSGDPWLVQCASKTDLAAAAADAGLGAHDVVELALPALGRVPTRVGLLDCAIKLPSGKSTLDRFKLDTAVTPTLLFVANGHTPVQVVPSMLAKHGASSTLFPNPRQQASALVALVKARATPRAYAFTKTEQLHAHCLKRRRCVLWLTAGEPSGEAARTLQRLLGEYRALAFGTINTARYDFSLAKHLPAPPTKRSPQVLLLRSTAVDGEPKKMTLGAKAHRGEATLAELRPVLTALTGDSLELTPLKKAPAMRWRKQGGGGSGKSGGSGSGSGGGGSGSRRERRGGAASGSAKQAAAGRRTGGEARSRQKKGAGGGGGGGGAAAAGGGVDEVERRRRMAAEEEEYMRSMFSADDDDGHAYDEGEAEETLDFDDDGDETGDDEGGENAKHEEEEAGEEATAEAEEEREEEREEGGEEDADEYDGKEEL